MNSGKDNPKLQTHDEDGYRVANHDSTLVFPNEQILEAALLKLNETASSHLSGRKVVPCADGQECTMCFMMKASAESEEFKDYVEACFHNVNGPLAHLTADFHNFFSTALFFYMLGRMTIKTQNPTDVKAEVDALNKLFNLEQKPQEGEEKRPN